MGLNRGVWAVSDVFMVGDPQPPDTLDPPPGEVNFVDYYRITATGDTVDGTDWLPDPTTHDSLIGIEFTATDSDSVATNRVIYEIFEVSQWVGQDMNTPSSPGEPDRDDSLWFDFHVYNPLYGAEPKYTVTTINYDEYDPYLKKKDGNLGQFLSTRRYTVERNELVKGDTLWLIARDYAAHAVIIPRGLSTYTLRLRNHVSPYDSSSLWAVTVPRDYDGWGDVGINKGDFMADKWEEDVLGVTRYNPAILTFYPFYHKNSQGAFDIGFSADRDSLPKGRNIYGDRFTNWEEYRGFHLEGDLDSTEYAQPKHVRLNPHKKNVMIDWRENDLEPEVIANIPAWLDQLRSSVYYDTLQIYFLDAHIFENERFSTERPINLNHKGAYFFYYSVPGVTNFPSDFKQNAVTWWDCTPREEDWLWNNYGILLRESNIAGACWSDMNLKGLYGFQAPEYHSRIYIVDFEIERYRTLGYYAGNDSLWAIDSDSFYRMVMTHEFGHSIGMEHLNDFHIMQNRLQTVDPNTGQIFPDPYFIPTFSSGNFGQITVRPR